MERSIRRTVAVAALAIAAPSAARAQESAAREAYDRGVAAHARHDYRAAASELARADELAPNPVALKAALDEALLADDAELGMTLVARAATRASNGELASSVRAARGRFASRTGSIRVDCGERACRVAIDARPAEAGAPRVVLVGPHRVTLDAGDASSTRDVTVAPEQEIAIVLAPPPPPTPTPTPTPPQPPPPTQPPPPSGLSPWWFTGFAIATGLAASGSVVSAVDTSNQHSTFASLDCAHGRDPRCPDLARAGSDAQTRTDVLAAATVALGVATIALAFVVRWRGPASTALVVGDRSAALRVRF